MIFDNLNPLLAGFISNLMIKNTLANYKKVLIVLILNNYRKVKDPDTMKLEEVFSQPGPVLRNLYSLPHRRAALSYSDSELDSRNHQDLSIDNL